MEKDLVLINNFIDGLTDPIVFLSSSLNIIDVNKASEKFFNMKKKDILGNNLSDICPDLHNPIKSKIVIEHRDLLWHFIESKANSKEIQYLLIGQNKFVYQNLLGLNDNADLIYEEVISLTKELSSKQKKDKTRDFENAKAVYQYMENIISEIPVSVYWMNRKHIYLGCSKNMAELLNLQSRHNIVGKTYLDLYDEKSSEYYQKADKEVMGTGISLSLEEPLYFADGTKKTYLSKKVPLLNSKQKIIGMLGVSIDITERKEAEQALKIAKEDAEAANIAKTNFIANMSHDIRTPLTGVIGLSEMLEVDIVDPVQKENASLLAESGKQLLNMLNEVLEDVQIGNFDDSDISNEKFDLHNVIRSLIKLENPTTITQNIELKCVIANDVPQFIVSDRKKITHILLNLIGNAIKFTKRGHVSIDVSLLSITDNRVKLRFEVIDTGVGIPENLQDKVFERFFKVEPSFKGNYRGYGLGLHIVRSYVELLGGKISICSQEGSGTSVCFDLTCDLTDLDVATNISYTQRDFSKDNSSFLRVLLVEDNNVALRVLENLVGQSELAYTSVQSAEHAYEILQTQSFDFILTDLGLPAMSGQELTFKIREFEKCLPKNTPIFGLTAHVNSEIKQSCLGLGMNDVFTKPISKNILQKIIDSISQKNKRQENIPNDNQLSNLDRFPILDINSALNNLGNDEDMYLNIIKIMLDGEISRDLLEIDKAYSTGDWQKVITLIHRFKSGIVYIGADKLREACSNLEAYFRTGDKVLLDDLYRQFLKIVTKTLNSLEEIRSSLSAG